MSQDGPRSFQNDLKGAALATASQTAAASQTGRQPATQADSQTARHQPADHFSKRGRCILLPQAHRAVEDLFAPKDRRLRAQATCQLLKPTLRFHMVLYKLKMLRLGVRLSLHVVPPPLPPPPSYKSSYKILQERYKSSTGSLQELYKVHTVFRLKHKRLGHPFSSVCTKRRRIHQCQPPQTKRNR